MHTSTVATDNSHNTTDSCYSVTRYSIPTNVQVDAPGKIGLLPLMGTGRPFGKADTKVYRWVRTATSTMDGWRLLSPELVPRAKRPACGDSVKYTFSFLCILVCTLCGSYDPSTSLYTSSNADKALTARVYKAGQQDVSSSHLAHMAWHFCPVVHAVLLVLLFHRYRR